MIKIRAMGEKDELQEFKTHVGSMYDLSRVSDMLPVKGSSKHHRLYMEASQPEEGLDDLQYNNAEPEKEEVQEEE